MISLAFIFYSLFLIHSGPQTEPNQDKSAARLCYQVAARVPDRFCNFWFVKSHKIANNSAITEAREKKSIDFESLECFD
jgi:hypothetical protein